MGGAPIDHPRKRRQPGAQQSGDGAGARLFLELLRWGAARNAAAWPWQRARADEAGHAQSLHGLHARHLEQGVVRARRADFEPWLYPHRQAVRSRGAAACRQRLEPGKDR